MDQLPPGRRPPNFRCDGEPLDLDPPPPIKEPKPVTIFDNLDDMPAVWALIQAMGPGHARRHGLASKVVRWRMDRVRAVTNCITAGLVYWDWNTDSLKWTPGAWGDATKLETLYTFSRDLLVAFGVVQDYGQATRFMEPRDPDFPYLGLISWE